ncbi:hypothetical protein [Mucilaginibacter aquaedulcis]|uniref:hypothetical protein n=1 Tax=Mucilaginibacter aquaedulcis TaxID=1187081 RepID=UPI0025B548A9|nr:hypothetical protein [Mucilaginibacter aquaedulcis]MDN3550212.1 hypothetical protein [Mucilaginibacter aquaedulcis]
MQKILTIELLDILINQGYRYCLSRTTTIVGEDADICIMLMPVKRRPLLKTLPQKFDTYFRIDAEPLQMAKGVDETIILVDLSEIYANGAMN